MIRGECTGPAPGAGRGRCRDVLPLIGEPEPHLAWAMLASLGDPGHAPTTLEQVTSLLEAAGFDVAAPRPLPRRPGLAALEVLTILDARRAVSPGR